MAKQLRFHQVNEHAGHALSLFLRKRTLGTVHRQPGQFRAAPCVRASVPACAGDRGERKPRRVPADCPGRALSRNASSPGAFGTWSDLVFSKCDRTGFSDALLSWLKIAVNSDWDSVFLSGTEGNSTRSTTIGSNFPFKWLMTFWHSAPWRFPRRGRPSVVACWHAFSPKLQSPGTYSQTPTPARGHRRRNSLVSRGTEAPKPTSAQQLWEQSRYCRHA